jgi:hypothetical protein
MRSSFPKALFALSAISQVIHGLQSAVFSSASGIQAKGQTFIVSNDDASAMTIWIEGAVGHLKTTLQSREALAIYHIPKGAQGAMRAIRSGDRANAATKFEFTLGGSTGDVINNSCGITLPSHLHKSQYH